MTIGGRHLRRKRRKMSRIKLPPYSSGGRLIGEMDAGDIRSFIKNLKEARSRAITYGQRDEVIGYNQRIAELEADLKRVRGGKMGGKISREELREAAILQFLSVCPKCRYTPMDLEETPTWEETIGRYCPSCRYKDVVSVGDATLAYSQMFGGKIGGKHKSKYRKQKKSKGILNKVKFWKRWK